MMRRNLRLGAGRVAGCREPAIRSRGTYAVRVAGESGDGGRAGRKHELAGLTPTQLAALATVEQAGPLRLGDLAAAERIAPSTLTRLVSALEEHGYVRRCAVVGDARAWTLEVTPRGHEVLDRIRQESTILLAGSLLTLSPEQLAALAAALPALEQLADVAPGDAGAAG